MLKNILIATLLACPPAALAADLTVALPAGWMPDYERYDARNNNVVLVLVRMDESPGSRVMQIRTNGTVFLTDFATRVTAVQYSFAADRLLVHHSPHAQETQSLSLVAVDGSITWTYPVDPDKYFQFSGDGSTIWTANKSAHSRWQVEVYNLDERIVRKWDLEGPMTGHHEFAVPSGPDELLLIRGVTLTRMRATESGISTVWNRNFDPSVEPNPRVLRAIGPNRFIADHVNGYNWRVIDGNGTTLYYHDPVALNAANPATPVATFAALQPSRGITADQVLAFANTAVGGSVDLATGTFAARTFDTEVAAGYTRTWIIDGKFLLLSTRSIRIRNL